MNRQNTIDNAAQAIYDAHPYVGRLLLFKECQMVAEVLYDEGLLIEQPIAKRRTR
ncbi:hypothetical protein BJD55_gp046 [Gordonia phage Yvonnetastic]|uniref:Uncharacterized protein n=1 Tax=Gordonia phage Yvonnetastic TaxID=1821566 RepID=A0A142K9D7_9CAUD|nr:hypothetical protein BJD55_gp046 [Gordonia phage Yvonnetastic]AMS02720.1 hypothetical protein SEA_YVONNETASTIC_176 [Gordonia phage Yvonnetastic]